MIIGVLKESANEHRVALTPEVLAKHPEWSVYIEPGAGMAAGYPDEAYQAAGAKLEANRKTLLEQIDILVTVSGIEMEALRSVRASACIIGMLNPLHHLDTMKQIARQGITAFTLEWLPRVTRAQAMDVLSSQNNLAGYQAVLIAAAQLGRAFPLMMTAAGSVPAARVLIIGAGVAGLQAIATAKRLGAVVSAFDVRPAAKEQVESLGATFIEVPSDEQGEGQGGYAKEMTAAYRQAQEQKLLKVIARQDVVITTAQIPNAPAPKIITNAMIQQMHPGALIIDLAGESGGNCMASQLGTEVEVNQVRILTPYRITNTIAHTASKLFASNIAAFIQNLITQENGALQFSADDERIQGTMVTHGGIMTHPLLKGK